MTEWWMVIAHTHILSCYNFRVHVIFRTRTFRNIIIENYTKKFPQLAVADTHAFQYHMQMFSLNYVFHFSIFIHRKRDACTMYFIIDFSGNLSELCWDTLTFISLYTYTYSVLLSGTANDVTVVSHQRKLFHFIWKHLIKYNLHGKGVPNLAIRSAMQWNNHRCLHSIRVPKIYFDVYLNRNVYMLIETWWT